jgi:hypothetical protein
LERPSTFTDVITSSASDTAAPPTLGANYVAGQVPTISWNRTLPPLPRKRRSEADHPGRVTGLLIVRP